VAQKEKTANPLKAKLGRLVAFAAPGPKTIQKGESISAAFFPIFQLLRTFVSIAAISSGGEGIFKY
jgi:hypothetical protein